MDSSWVFETQFVTPPHAIFLFNSVFLVAYCIAPSHSSPYGARHGSEHGRDAQIIPTEHTFGQETGELQSPHHESTSSETLLMTDELEPSWLNSNRHTRPTSRNKRRLRQISDSLFEEGDSLFNTYVSIQCCGVFNDKCKNGFTMSICPFVHPWTARCQIRQYHFCQCGVLFLWKSIILRRVWFPGLRKCPYQYTLRFHKAVTKKHIHFEIRYSPGYARLSQNDKIF